MSNQLTEKDIEARVSEELKKRDVKSYMDYLSLGSRTTKNYLMISELIDNSISSFDREFGEGKWKEQLIIEINLNWNSVKKSWLKGDPKDREFYPENSIVIRDNAMGMNDEELLNAVKLNKVNVQSTSSKNVHGRGLKQSAFYYGMDLSVRTNNGTKKSEICIKASKQDSQLNEIIFEVSDYDGTLERGTEVVISSLNTYQVFTPKKWVGVVNALAVRYSRYLSNENGISKMKILYKNTFRDKQQVELVKSNKEIKVNPSEGEITPNTDLKISTVSQAWDSKLYSTKEKLATAFSKNLTKRMESKTSKTIDLDWDAISQTKDKIVELLRGDQELFKWELNFKFGCSILPVKFYRLGLKDKYSQWRGFTVYEGNRALKHGPIAKGEQETYLKWKRTSTSTGSTDNRFAGSFDVTDFSFITTTTDKSEFRMPVDFNDDLDNFLFSVWYAFDVFENLSRSSKKVKEISQWDEEQIQRALSTKYSPGSNLNISSENISFTNLVVDGDFNIGEEELWKIKLIPVDQNVVNNSNEIIHSIEIVKEKFECILYFNNEAIIWKSANTGKNFHTEVQYPILVQLAVQFINLKFYDADPKNAINNIRGTYDGELDF